MVFSVHMLFDSQPGEPWGDELRHSRLVFIGRELNQTTFKKLSNSVWLGNGNRPKIMELF